MNELIAGVDIGGTKTHIRVVNSSGRHVDRILPTSDWRSNDWARDAQVLFQLLNETTDVSSVGFLVVGARGCDSNEDCDEFQNALSKRGISTVKVINDAELLPAALGFRQSIGLVVGTGSIAVCRNSHDEMLVAGGWGWIIGDEGSASGMVREAARSIKHLLDYDISANDPLIALMLDALDISSPNRIGKRLAALGSAANLGRFAPIVFEASDRGSGLARQVINEGTDKLVELISKLRSKGSKSGEVVIGGGLISAQQNMANKLIGQIERTFEGQITAHLFTGPPVTGACQIAADLRSRSRVYA